MSQEPEKTNEGQQKRISKESHYCYQLASYYCKNQCPNDCYQRYQEKINKLFSNLNDSEKQ